MDPCPRMGSTAEAYSGRRSEKRQSCHCHSFFFSRLITPPISIHYVLLASRALFTLIGKPMRFFFFNSSLAFSFCKQKKHFDRILGQNSDINQFKKTYLFWPGWRANQNLRRNCASDFFRVLIRTAD